MRNTHKPSDILKKQHLKQQLYLCTHTEDSVSLSRSLFLSRTRAHTHCLSFSLSHTPMRNTHKPRDILKKQYLMQQLHLCTRTAESLSLFLSLTLSLFLSLARTHTHTVSLALSHTHTYAQHTQAE